jgi:hypothetical protein
MRRVLGSSFASAVAGGLVVAVAFLGLGITGRRTTRTIIQEAPIASAQASSTGSELTPHAIYQRDAPGVVFVRANIVRKVQDPFDLLPEQQRTTATGSGSWSTARVTSSPTTT